MMAVIGGTGFAEFLGMSMITGEIATTPWGDTYLETGELVGVSVMFLPRHGHPPAHPPHRINYRANIDALAARNIDTIIAVHAVGGVDPALPVPSLVVPDQIIDYTWGRAQTFFDSEIHHIDLSYPYDAALRESLIAASDGFPLSTSGVYGCTQGPRLETAAEVRRLRQDGCDIVGMTAMPEAALARERGISYGALCVVVNPGAGIDNEPVAMEQIEAVLGQGMSWVRDALCRFVSHLPEANT